MPLYKKFNKLSRLVQLILLLIPFVGWVTEILVRGSAMLAKKDLFHIVVFIVYIVCGAVLAFLDFFWVLLFRHLLFAD